MEKKIKNKLLLRSAKSLLRKMQNQHSRWEKGIGNLQYQGEDPDTRQHFYSAIDCMKRFVDNIS